MNNGVRVEASGETMGRYARDSSRECDTADCATRSRMISMMAAMRASASEFDAQPLAHVPDA